MSGNKINFIRSLHLKKFRDKEGLFIAEGDRLVSDLLQSCKTHSIYATAEWKKGNVGNVEARHASSLHSQTLHATSLVTEQELKKISLLKTPQHVIGIFYKPSTVVSAAELIKKPLLALDGISDPGNFGTIVRTADWFGFRHIICSENCVDVYNPKTVQATMGSVARVGVHYRSLKDFFKEITGNIIPLWGATGGFIPVYGFALKGRNIYKMSFPEKFIILIGSEARGISEDLLPCITESVSIPSFGNAESLNAAVAAAIACYEVKRFVCME